MKTLLGFGKEPKTMQLDADLETNLKTLLQSLSLENSKASLEIKALTNILSIIANNLELQKGYLAALQGTSQRIYECPLINPQEMKKMMGHISGTLSGALEVTWNATMTVDLINQCLIRRSN